MRKIKNACPDKNFDFPSYGFEIFDHEKIKFVNDFHLFSAAGEKGNVTCVFDALESFIEKEKFFEISKKSIITAPKKGPMVLGKEIDKVSLKMNYLPNITIWRA